MIRCAWLLLFSSLMSAATLKPESVQAWDKYLAAVEVNLEKSTQENATFLWVDQSNGRRQRVRAGEIVVDESLTPGTKKTPSALIHDWTGAAFMPGTRIEDVISVVRDYGHYKDYYSPSVIRSKTVEQNQLVDRFSVVLMNQT
jgi:hypothetical protein